MTSNTRKKEKKADYVNLRAVLLSELERIEDEKDCSIHTAFVYETAQVFSSTSSGFSATDGRNEWGIDFCRVDTPIFTIAQCKCPERETLEKSDKPEKYDRKALEDLLTGINYILDRDNTYPDAIMELKQFKNSYHDSVKKWPKETSLQTALAVFGVLTPQAKNYFNN